MHKFYFLKILTLLFLPFQIFAYDFSFQKDDNLLQIDFQGNQVKEIKFDLKMGIISNEVNGNLGKLIEQSN